MQIISTQRSYQMWTAEYGLETTVEPAAIWRAWTDVAKWPEWNGDLSRATLTGTFAAGGTIDMTLDDGALVALRLAEVKQGRSFVDEADVAGTVIRTHHRIDNLGCSRSRVVYRLEAEGPQEAMLGPAISADFGEVITELVAHAGQ